MDLTLNWQSFWVSGVQQPLCMWPFRKSAPFIQDGWHSYVYSLVFITSTGLVIIPATPPLMPAQKKYQKRGLERSQGLTEVFKFSFMTMTVEANGMFIKTVRG